MFYDGDDLSTKLCKLYKNLCVDDDGGGGLDIQICN